MLRSDFYQASKDNYRLGEDIQSKVLSFAFGLSAEIERNLISQRTKEALARKRAECGVLGRAKGRKTTPITGQYFFITFFYTFYALSLTLYFILSMFFIASFTI